MEDKSKIYYNNFKSSDRYKTHQDYMRERYRIDVNERNRCKAYYQRNKAKIKQKQTLAKLELDEMRKQLNR